MPKMLRLSVAVATVCGGTCGLMAQAHAAENPLANRPKADEVFYQIMPIAFRDGDGDPDRFGDFRGLRDGLDYIQGLGATSIWLNPIFPSPAYHGYQHMPAETVNPRLGTEAEYLAFVTSANARKVGVYLDFVAYQVNWNSSYAQSAFANPASPFDSWLAFLDEGNFNFTGNAYPTWNGDTVRVINWDLRTPAARDAVIGWSKKWLDPNGDGDFSDGASGFRLDHVWQFYNQGPDGWGYNLGSFWVAWHNAMREVRPDVFTIAEQANWGSTGAEFLGVFGAAFTKPIQFAARDALANESAAPLYNAFASALTQMPATGTFLCTIGDHDVDRLASAIGADSPAFAYRSRLAAAILCTQPFPPVVYSGDEIGMLGVKGDYGSDANDIPMREPFKWNVVDDAPMSRYHALNPQALANQYSQDFDGRSVEEQDLAPASLLNSYRRFIEVRKANVALRRGTYRGVPCDDGAVWAFHRRYEQGQAPIAAATQTLLVVMNLSAFSANAALDLSEFAPSASRTAKDILTGRSLPAVTPQNAEAYAVALAPGEVLIIEVDLPPAAVTPDPVDGRNLAADHRGADGRTNLVATQTQPPFLYDALNAMWIKPERDALRIGISGTDDDLYGPILCVFFDSIAGGQQSVSTTELAPPPFGLQALTGTRFDPGFLADRLLFTNNSGGVLYADWVTLRSGFPRSSKRYLGQSPVGGIGKLIGGSNPNGLRAALDPSGGQGATDTGYELRVPYADLGLAIGDCQAVRVLALVLNPNGTFYNQWLPSSGLWVTASPDFTFFPGSQFVTVRVPSRADFDADGKVDDSDFQLFSRAYDAMIVPEAEAAADFNTDGVVDDADFQVFAGAYLAMVCGE